MKIAYVGNFKPPHSTENHLALTLEKLGHKVIRIQEDDGFGRDTTPAMLDEALILNDYQLFLFTRTWGKTVQIRHIEWLRNRRIPSVSYHLDLYVGLKRDGGMDHDPFWRTDYVFTPDGDPRSAEVFKAKGINHHYMRPGVYEDECYIADVPAFERDLIFVGSYRGYHPEWPYREQLINWLRKSYRHRFELWGPQGKGTVRGDDLNRLYASTKIVVGDSLVQNFDHQYYWSDRIYETLGRGGFLIHPDVKGLREEFTHAKHLILYELGNFKQLAYWINEYYRNDKEREQIRRAGHELVKNNYTYTHRLKEMFKVIGAKK